jgi:hypothetical protein
MEAKRSVILAVVSWTLAAVSQGQNLARPSPSPELAFQEIDTIALDKPGDLPTLLRAKLSATPPVGSAGALVGRAFQEVGERMTVPLARSIIFESVYADQEAVLEIVRQALLNSPARLHAQIVAAAILSVTDPERLVIIEVAGPVPAPGNLETTDLAANPLAQEGPLAYRLAATGETGALALGVAILAVATSVDPNLDLTQFPISLNGYFLPGFNPPGFATGDPYDLGEPVDQRILDPRLPLVSPSPSPISVSPTPSPIPVIPTPSPPPVRHFPSPPPTSPTPSPTPVIPTPPPVTPTPTPISRRPTPTPTPVSP